VPIYLHEGNQAAALEVERVVKAVTSSPLNVDQAQDVHSRGEETSDEIPSR
jgi:hypothetical protein